MRTAIGSLILIAAIFLAFFAQEYLPALEIFHGARILLVPMLFCYGALALPFWAVILLAVYTGLLSDLWYLHGVDGRVEIALGWSMMYFIFLGMFVHGFEPAFRRGAWWLHPILSIFGTSLFLALQFVMISFRRAGFEYHELVLWRVLAPGLMAGLLAPIVHFIAWQGGQFFPADPFRQRRYWQEA